MSQEPLATVPGLPRGVAPGLLSRRRLLTGAAALAVGSSALLVTGCSSSGTSESAGGRIQTLRWALGSAPTTLDFSANWSGDWQAVQWLLHESLITYDGYAAAPALAEFEVRDDTTFVYTLREGATFHDGSPVTPDDVLFSFEHARREDSQQRDYLAGIASVEQSGDREVTIALSAPNAAFQFVPVLAPIIPRAFAEELGDDLGAPGKVSWVGSGPYKLERFTADAIAVVRYDGYWGDAPAPERIEFSFVPDKQALQLAIQSGQVDGTFQSEITPRWERISTAELVKSDGLGLNSIAFNVQAEPWNDVHVRRAFAHALNREGIAKAVYEGAVEPTTTMIPPAQWGELMSVEDATELYAGLTQYPYDLDLAREELGRSGVPDGFEASIKVIEKSADVRAMTAFAADLDKIGITLEVEEVPLQSWLDYVYGERDDLGVTFSSLGPDYPDPANYPMIVFGSDQATTGGFNTANYQDAATDRILEQQNATLDPQERVRLLTEVLETAADQLPYLPLWTVRSAMSLSTDFSFGDYTPLAGAWTPWAAQIRRA